MKFSKLVYQRPDVKTIEVAIASLTKKFESSEHFTAQLEVMQQINKVQIDFESACAIANVRFNLNASDTFYEQEANFYNEYFPKFSASLYPYYSALLQSRFRTELEQHFGKRLFQMAELFVQENNEKIIDIEQKINRLEKEYTMIVSQATIDFKGKQLPLPTLFSFMDDENRATRKEVQDVYSDFWVSNLKTVNVLFGEMVQSRHDKAQKLGFKNFIELAYNKNAYDGAQVTAFNTAVRKHLLPIRTRLQERKEKRLGLGELYYYDTLLFKNGNPKLQVNFEETLSLSQKMYAELSLETGEFYQFMRTHELMDLKAKEGKYPGAYHRPILNPSIPFVLANFNSTEHDFHVLTHELGHAFQYYSTVKNGIQQVEHLSITADIAEIHAIGMEMFTWKWYPLFFKEDTLKYQFSKINGLLAMIISCCLAEDFQQFAYQNLEATSEERHQKWMELNQHYYPYINPDTYFGDNDYQRTGQDWCENMHIVCYPFYMVDYALATICAVQLWMKAQNDWEGAWQDYLQLCKVGGKYSYFETLKLANLRSPFDENVIKEVADFLNDWLEGVDDGAF